MGKRLNRARARAVTEEERQISRSAGVWRTPGQRRHGRGSARVSCKQHSMGSRARRSRRTAGWRVPRSIAACHGLSLLAAPL